MIMDFSEAFTLLRKGKKVKRESWSEGSFVVRMPGLYLQPNNSDAKSKVNDKVAMIVGTNTSLQTEEYFAKTRIVDGIMRWSVGWTPSTEDLAATDWRKV